jgi:hypothetical protein
MLAALVVSDHAQPTDRDIACMLRATRMSPCFAEVRDIHQPKMHDCNNEKKKLALKLQPVEALSDLQPSIHQK